MKKEKLFDDKYVADRIILSQVKGGNKSDAWGGPTDTKIDGGSYDTLIASLKDVVKTTDELDKPAEKVSSSYGDFYASVEP